MSSKAELVDQVKLLQRSDPGAKQAWWDYCDSQLGGIKDPNRHDESTLLDFIDSYASGGIAPSAPAPRQPQRSSWAPAGGGKGPGKGRSWAPAPAPAPRWAPQPMAQMGMAMGGASLSDFVKTGQRQSQNWKAAWQTYCGIYGAGMNDPNKHDETFIKGFIDYVGELAVIGLADLAAQEGISLDQDLAPRGGGYKRGPPAGAWGPPAKRQATQAPWQQGSDDPEKAGLVEKVKALQRADPSAKQAWWTYCDANAAGAKDPNRHDAESLHEFLAGFE